MTTVTIPGPGMLWPPNRWGVGSNQAGGPVVLNPAALNAATDKLTFSGYLYVQGRPTSSKTLSAAGGGTIGFRLGSLTWADVTTSLDIGIQGVATTAGGAAVPCRPNGTYSVQATYVPGTDTLTANAWNTVAMDSGTVSLTHGDLISVVFDMTARGGTDSVQFDCGTQTSSISLPSVNEFQAGAWRTTAISANGNVVITFDDGTIATIENTLPFSTFTQETWNSGTNPDERGIAFQVPFDCACEGFYYLIHGASGSADGTMKLYSDPFGTPSLVKSVTVDGNISTQNSARIFSVLFSPTVNLTANTDYVLAHLADTATNRSFWAITVNSSAHLDLYPGTSLVNKATRDGSTGAFSETANTVYEMGIIISSISGFGGGSGGGIKLAGHGGLAG